MVKFLHAADLHLDSPLTGLTRYDGAPVEAMRAATRRALDNLVALAIEEAAAFVLLAGDLYDGDWRDYNTGLFFAAEMVRLREAGVEVVIVMGNHDAASQITRSLRMPENVTLLPTNKPDTVMLEDFGVAIHGRSFASRAVTDDLSISYPAAVPGLLNIGLLHTSADGRPRHDPYAPCSIDGLRAKGYDYWALGHVHAREALCQDPWIVFPGNTQGRHVGETGPKGCELVTVEDGEVIRVEPRELDVVRWVLCHVDTAEARCGDDVADYAAAAAERALATNGGMPLAIRFQLIGASIAHNELVANQEHWVNEIRAAVIDVSRDAWVERVVVQTAPQRASPTGGDAAAGELLAAIQEAVPSEEELEAIGRDLKEFALKLPAELRSGEDGDGLTDEASIQKVVGQGRALLAARLSSREREP